MNRSFNSLVTGGVQGIGRAIVEQLHARGDTLFVFDIIDLQDRRVKGLKEEGVWYCSVDVGSLDSIKQGFAQLSGELDKQKDSSLHLLVNNAGITRDNLALRLTEEQWDDMMSVNLKGAFFCAQYALQKMIRQSIGYIINISSVVGLKGNPGQAHYAASKAGIISLTKSLAYEYARRNVLVNSIAPGFIQTPLTDRLTDLQKKKICERIALQRFGTPDDVAHLVSFLSSGKADYMTGNVIELTGGMW